MVIRHFRFSLILSLFFSLYLSSTSLADETAIPKSLAMLPLQINAAKDISYLQSGIRNMLASRLTTEAGVKIINQSLVSQHAPKSGQISDVKALQDLGRTLQADYLLTGTMTAIGKSLSLDATLYSISEDKPVDSFYASAATEDDIISAVDSLAWDIAEKSFGKQRPVPKYQATAPAMMQPTMQAAAPTTAAGQAVPSTFKTAHPDRQFMGSYPGGMRGGSSPFIRPTTITGAFGFTKTQNLSLSMQSMDVGDIDGDGQLDVAIAGKNKVIAYHLINNRLVQFGEVELISRYKIIAMDLADLNDNGKSEIYVTAVDWITPNAVGVEWKGKDFEYLFKNERWCVKPMKVPGPGMVLAGQKMFSSGAYDEINDLFTPGIFQLRIAEGGILQKDGQLPVPDSVNLYDFSLADLDGDGKVEVITIDESDKLKVLTASGKQLWKGDEHYGGSLRYVGGESLKAKSDREILDTRDKERVYIHSRIIIKDINNDNLPDVIVNKNLSTASRVMKNLKNYPSGEIHGLSWNGIGLTELWRTRKIDGYVSSYQMVNDAENKDAATLFVGLVMNSGWMDILSAKDSTVLMYPLDFSQQEKPQQPQQGYQYMQ